MNDEAVQPRSLPSDLLWTVRLWNLTVPLGSRVTGAGASMAGLRREQRRRRCGIRRGSSVAVGSQAGAARLALASSWSAFGPGVCPSLFVDF